MQADDIYKLMAKIVVMAQRAMLEPLLEQSELTHLQVAQEVVLVVVELAALVGEEQEVVVVQERRGSVCNNSCGTCPWTTGGVKGSGGS